MQSQTYITSLSIEDCRSLLGDPKYAPPKFFTLTPFNPPPKGTVFARIRGDRFRLFATGSKYIQNSFAPFFYGSLESVQNGTRIQGRFRMHLFTRAFMGVWFGFLGFIILVIITSLLSGDRDFQQPLHVIFGMPLIMVVFGIALVYFAWSVGRGQRESMKDFIQSDLLAKPESRF